ncbi:GNAT family N-acetyltransferase [Microbulbifer sediminum]|uniref:GNAT family N-acetyltransferase n=1 Tax=Microbulbifer sediminum TaxID=2904250 RepID=UPI001F269E68|nr:GNAT family N-acetyltransferase [Microbulbifer sediminum]
MSEREPVTTYYLEMQSPGDLRGKAPAPGLEVVEAEIREFRFNRYLYQLVGEPWQWVDRLALPDEDWKQYAERDALRTWVAYYRGSIAGYYELEQQADGNVQIAYFGLAPRFVGMGFGGYLLTHALQSAWDWAGTRRVWVHTCTLDHPGALNNYRARGMRVYRTEQEPAPAG